MAKGEEIRNETTGSVCGNVLQIGNVHGDVLGWQQPSAVPSAEKSLHEPLWRLTRAVRQASAEVVRRWGISSSDAISVRWRTATDDLVDHWENIHDRNEPVSLEGQFTAVRETYQAVRSKRLVILGRAGAGKTVLAHRLILDLLDSDSTIGPVPVLLSLGGWNPASTDLQSFVIRHLLRDFGFLNGKNPVTGETQGEVLVTESLILPVLDGFDEIPHHHQRAAIRQISGSDSPLVVTSRPQEYREAAHTVRAVGRAAAIEIQDIAPEEAHRYLRLSTSKPRSREWDAVFDRLRAQPDQTACQNLARLLNTPLMVTLTRATYNDTAARQPDELLDIERFPNTVALEDHLLDEYLDTVYASTDTRHRRTQGTPWDPDRARHWLSYLSTHLERRDTHDLSWWSFPVTLHCHTRIFITAAAAGLGLGLLVLRLVLVNGFALINVLVNGLVFGLTLGLSSEVALARGRNGREPERLRLGLPRRDRAPRTRSTYSKLTSEFTNGLMLGVVIVLVPALVPVLVKVLVNKLVLSLVFGITFGLLVGVVLGIGNVVVSALGDAYDPHATDPWTLLTRDRTVTLVRTTTTTVLAFGLVLGVGLGGGDAAMIGLTAGLARLAFSAWGNWLLFARLWLPLTGRLPWRPKRFLEDAYQRGVLRQAGAVYQFRHARLRDHLSREYRAQVR